MYWQVVIQSISATLGVPQDMVSLPIRVRFNLTATDVTPAIRLAQDSRALLGTEPLARYSLRLLLNIVPLASQPPQVSNEVFDGPGLVKTHFTESLLQHSVVHGQGSLPEE